MANNMDLDLVRVNNVCFHDNILSEGYFKMQQVRRHHFQDKILSCLELSTLSCSCNQLKNN